MGGGLWVTAFRSLPTGNPPIHFIAVSYDVNWGGAGGGDLRARRDPPPDGEGCFDVSITENKKFNQGW